MTKLARALCFLVILGSSAVAAYAQTPIDASGLAGADPTISVRSPDPACTDCVDLTWNGTAPPTGSETDFFFYVPGYPPTGIIIPPDYSCEVDPSSTNPIACNALTKFISGNPEFVGVELIVYSLTDGESFSFGATGGRVTLVVPADSGLTCNADTPCNPDGSFMIGPTPEPGTALLFMTGLIPLVGFCWRRFRSNPIA
jgi:hypothetical protein